ncbi:MAG: 16S rRNA (cytosine(1402)-N(4))-methyltransferase RsmH [Candidatus Limnocylindrales bacterium]
MTRRRHPGPVQAQADDDGEPIESRHLPVLASEVASMLAPAPGSLQIDATLGGGGHAERTLAATDPDGRLLGLDADGAAIARVAARLRPRFGDRLVVRQANFRDLAKVAPEAGFASVDGALFDLGLSSDQLADTKRGFGFRAGGPLDMRFDPARGVAAAELLATLDAAELAALFRRNGEEPRAGRIARAIVDARRVTPITTAHALAELIERVVPPNPRLPRRAHPATRVFQALRIAVNDELEALQSGLAAALLLLRPGGRLVVLSYHSLEDRIVKRFLAAERRGCVCPPEVPLCVCGRNPRLRLLTRPSLTPGSEELASNPRARSARLRAAERLAA